MHLGLAPAPACRVIFLRSNVHSTLTAANNGSIPHDAVGNPLTGNPTDDACLNPWKYVTNGTYPLADDANADTAPGTVPGGPSAFAPAGGGDGGGDVTENRVRSPRAQEAAHTLLAGAFPGAAGWRGSPLRPPARS